DHSNSYEAWKRMGSPQQPSPEQYAQLEKAARLELLEPPRWIVAKSNAVTLGFRLPRQGVSLVELRW
ncbi:MAG: beta-xylosidase, partial [Acidobacteriota bacterium]